MEKKKLEKFAKDPLPAFKIEDATWNTNPGEVNFKTSAVYLADAIEKVAQQDDCVYVGFQLRSMKVSANEFRPGWFVVGKGADLKFLDSGHHFVAAPCPDFCSGGDPMVGL